LQTLPHGLEWILGTNSYPWSKSYPNSKFPRRNYIKFYQILTYRLLWILISNPLWIWGNVYGESCSSLRYRQNHILLAIFGAQKGHFRDSQSLKQFEIIWIQSNLDFFFNGLNRRCPPLCRGPTCRPPSLAPFSLSLSLSLSSPDSHVRDSTSSSSGYHPCPMVVCHSRRLTARCLRLDTSLLSSAWRAHAGPPPLSLSPPTSNKGAGHRSAPLFPLRSSRVHVKSTIVPVWPPPSTRNPAPSKLEVFICKNLCKMKSSNLACMYTSYLVAHTRISIINSCLEYLLAFNLYFYTK
jgi:hypothetical protein